MYEVLFEGIVVYTAPTLEACEEFVADCIRYQFPHASVTRTNARRWYVFSGCGVTFVIR